MLACCLLMIFHCCVNLIAMARIHPNNRCRTEKKKLTIGAISSSYLSLVGVLLYCYKISNAKIFSPFVKWSSCIILIKKVMSYSFGSVVFTKPIKNCSVKYNKKHRLQIKIFVKYTLNHHT